MEIHSSGFNRSYYVTSLVLIPSKAFNIKGHEELSDSHSMSASKHLQQSEGRVLVAVKVEFTPLLMNLEHHSCNTGSD